MNLSQFIVPLREIAKNAGAKILEIYHDPSSDFELDKKADESPLTKADVAANDIIVDGLNKLDIIFPILSEENKGIPYEERKNLDYYWCVDPLDGTKEFIKKNGEFTVNIALIHDNETVLGVVYAPELDKMYWAAKDLGAFRQIGTGEEQKLEANSFSKEDKGLRMVCSRSHMDDDTKAFVNQYTEPELTSMGSSLKFMLIAEGNAEIYPRLAPTMEWDTAAAQIVVEEAGGTMVDFKTKNKFKYNKEILRNNSFVAYAKI